LQVLRAVSARRDRGELGSAASADPRVLLTHVLDDVEFGLTLVHQPTRRLARANSDVSVVEGDARLRERVEKARVNVRVGMGRHR
jgi:hypothetical protein